MPEISLPSFPFTPQLGWSTTRSETFRTCRRRYFYPYYGKFDPEIPLERILQLKGLSSIPMTVGTAVHDVLATLLQRLPRTTAPIDRERFAQHTERTLADLLRGLGLMEAHYRQRPQAVDLLNRLQRDRMPTQGTPELRAAERRRQLQRGCRVLGGAGGEGLTPTPRFMPSRALGYGSGLFAVNRRRTSSPQPTVATKEAADHLPWGSSTN